jgi:hypothetical protein
MHERKWTEWIFAGHGHGPDWRRVFGAFEFEEVWRAVATAVLTAPVEEIRDLGDLGFDADAQRAHGRRPNFVALRR